jgi:RimJ/RimL family protein N-acetyltransferase
VYRIDWSSNVGQLAAIEPEPAEISAHADELAVGYNEPANAALMGHTEEISPADVIAHYLDMAADGARQFLLFIDGKLAGDADLRGFHDSAAEFAFMIGARDQQGKGLGTRFALMTHALGFRELGLARIYASVVPHNTASRRVFEKLGYVLDDSAEAREFADEPGDVVLVIDRATFEARNAEALAEVRISSR